MKLFVMSALAVLALAGCSGESRAVYDQRARVWRSTKGDFAMDPVSGEQVVVATAVVRRYEGILYYFANDDHARRFDADPQRFAFPELPQESETPAVR